MRFDIGSMIAIAAALIFYLRLIVLQRQRSQSKGMRAQNQAALTQRAKQSGDWQEKNRNASSPTDRENPIPGAAQLIRWNWYLVGFGILLIGIGAVFSVSPWPGAFAHSWWWVPVTGGILLMTLSIR